MGEVTAISWCDHTFNPWIGCTKVSPACDGCYAENLMANRYGRVEWGAPGKGNGTRSRTSPANWRQPLRWNRKAEAEGTRPFVFCSSLADVFDNQVPAEWRVDLFELIRATPKLVWLLLTKRPQNIVRFSREAGGLPWNAALGATFANQEEYDRDRMKLWEAGRRLLPLFTFGSFEPLLGQVILDKHSPDWIITGGETDQGGHKARPTHPDWFRSLRDQCVSAGVPFHHKQNGEWVADDGSGGLDRMDKFLGKPEAFSETDEPVFKIGKRHTGRLLDGLEHNARPEVLT